jgi:hypothetical protein
MEMTPARSSSRSRLESRPRGIPGAPERISPNVEHPRSRLRTMTGVQRSARISDALATGQNWP